MSLKRIAEELGLSLTTVSRALNGYPEVAATTRREVMEAATRLHYRPDARARGLALGRADAVGIVFPITTGDLGDQQFLQVASSMGKRFAQASMDLLIVSASADDELAAYERAITGRHIGVFVVPRTRVADRRLQLLQSRNVPFVAYGRSSTLAEPYAWFDFDNLAGARMAAERLLSLGHRRIGYIGASPEYNFADQRFNGFCSALKAENITIATDAVQRVALDRRSGYAAMQNLLALPERPTAVLVDNNLAGIGAVHAAMHSGLMLGRDLSIIVYDGVGPDSVVRARVTAVMQPTPEATGVTLAEMTLARMRNDPLDTLQKLCMPELEIGDSDGPPVLP